MKVKKEGKAKGKKGLEEEENTETKDDEQEEPKKLKKVDGEVEASGAQEKEGNGKEENEVEEPYSFHAFYMTRDDFQELETEGSLAPLIEMIQKFDGMLLAEVFPEHKYSLIGALQKAGFVVGMVGDGVNDAAAMQRADVSFAPTDSTQAANAAADFIMREPDLGGIIHALQILKHKKEKDSRCVLN